MQLQSALLVFVLRDSGLDHDCCNSPERSCQMTFTLWPHWWIYSMHNWTSLMVLLYCFSTTQSTRDWLLRSHDTKHMDPCSGGTDDSVKCLAEVTLAEKFPCGTNWKECLKISGLSLQHWEWFGQWTHRITPVPFLASWLGSYLLHAFLFLRNRDKRI